MAQLKKMQNTMSDHPELQRLLESVDLGDLFNDDDDENDDKKETEKK